jgi:hypothetical protein
MTASERAYNITTIAKLVVCSMRGKMRNLDTSAVPRGFTGTIG